MSSPISSPTFFTETATAATSTTSTAAAADNTTAKSLAHLFPLPPKIIIPGKIDLRSPNDLNAPR